MPGTPADVACQTTVTFGTSAFTAQITQIGFSGVSRESIDTTHFTSTEPSGDEFGAKTFIPACFSDGGEFTMDIHFNPFTVPPIDQAPETITVTWPLVAGDTTSTIWSFTGFVTTYDMTGPMDDVMTGTVTVKVSGVVSITKAT